MCLSSGGINVITPVILIKLDRGQLGAMDVLLLVISIYFPKKRLNFSFLPKSVQFSVGVFLLLFPLQTHLSAPIVHLKEEAAAASESESMQMLHEEI